jgi:hypothetical protein
VAAAPPPNPLPALTILTIQQKAYAEGFAAGKWVQARRDQAEAAQQAKESVITKAVPDTVAPDNGSFDPGMPDTTAQTVDSTPSAAQPGAIPPVNSSPAPSATAPAPAPDFVPAGPAQAIPAQQ